MDGVEVQLFGIDAVELDQFCLTGAGERYPCGQQAAMTLQRLVQNVDVLCLSLFAVNASRVVGLCSLHQPDRPVPEDDDDFIELYAEDSLSRQQVEQGYALSIGIGESLFSAEQNQAQVLRVGIWQGSFQPPASYRSQRE